MDEQLSRAIDAAFDLDGFRQRCADLYAMERRFCYRDFQRSAGYCLEVMQAAGLEDAERIDHAADGRTEHLDFVMPEAWDVDDAELSLVEADGSESVITRTQDDPFCVANRCAPTPPEGMTCELVLYENVKSVMDLTGKLVLVRRQSPRLVQTQLSRQGAAGVVSGFSRGPHELPDTARWVNGGCGPGWYHTKDDRKLVVFCLSPRKAEALAARLERGRVWMKARVDARIYDGAIATVTGTIPGRSTDEIILLAHIYEPFMTDDAAGASGVVEIARILNRLIADGVMPRPEKTVRFMLGMERYGFGVWFADEACRRRAQLVINMDSIATDPAKTRMPVMARGSASVQPFWADHLFHAMARYALAAWPVKAVRNNLSDDCFMSDPTLGVPSWWVHVHPGIYHHNAADCFAGSMDWDLGRSVTCLKAKLVATLAAADETERRALAERLARDACAVLHSSAAEGAELDFLIGRERLRAESLKTFWPDVDTASILARLDACAEALRVGEGESPTLSLKEQAAVRITVERIGVGFPFSEARVPVAKRMPILEETIDLLSWCDGERTLLDAVQCYRLDGGEPVDDARISEIIKELRFCAKYDYVALHYATTPGKGDLVTQIRELGISPGDAIIVHSSFAAMGPVDGGPLAVCEALQEAIGAGGLLMMPAFCFTRPWERDAAAFYSPDDTPSECGVISETFRSMPGVFRSLNPTHSFCAWGKDAESLVAGHEKVTTMGEGSPLQRLEARGGKAVLIENIANTFHHVVEMTPCAKCLKPHGEAYPARMIDGTDVMLPTWGWRERACPVNDSGHDVVAMDAAGVVTRGLLGLAEAAVFTMADCRAVVEQLMAGERGCPTCPVRPRAVDATV